MTNGDGDGLCQRSGFRFEFRRYDEDAAELLAGGTRGIDISE